MTDLTASVIINNRNYGRYLIAAIDSALNQTRVPEVVVVDDGSSDSSCEVLARYEDEIVCIQQPHSGQAAALNRGVRAASGDVVILLDSDDLMDRNKVERILRVFEDAPEVEWLRHDLRAIAGDTVVAPHYYPLRKHPDPLRQVRSVGDATGTTSALAFRASFLAAIGPIPEERYPTYADRYLKVVAALLGQSATVDEVLGSRRLHEHQVTSYGPTDPGRTRFHLKLGESIACDAAWQASRHGIHPDVAEGRLWWQQKLRFEARKGGVVADGRAFPFLIGMMSNLGASDLSISRRTGMAVRELLLAALPKPLFRRAWWRTHLGRRSTVSRLLPSNVDQHTSALVALLSSVLISS
jgi:glycosyltransferase involved in cell wall biosynthesis